MRIPTRPIARPPARAPESPAALRPNDRNCRSLSSAKGVLEPNQAVRAVRRTFHGEHIEAHGAAMPLDLPLQQVSGGAYDFALLTPRNGLQRSAELLTAALPNFDDRQHAVVETNQIEFAGPAAQITRQDFETATLQVVRGELFRCHAALPAQIRHLA